MNVVRLEEEDGDLVRQRHLLVDPTSGNNKTPNQGPSWTDRHALLQITPLWPFTWSVFRVLGLEDVGLLYSRNNTSSFWFRVLFSVPSYLYRSFFPRFHRKWTWATWMNRTHLCSLGLSLEAMAKRHSRSPEVQVPIDATRRRWKSNITTFGI